MCGIPCLPQLSDLPPFSHSFITGDSQLRLTKEQGHGPATFECLAELPWGAVVERAMGALAVVLLTPGRECTPDVVQGAEPVSVEALIAQPAVEALDVAVLHGPARLDVA